VPTYTTFAERFQNGERFPDQHSPGISIRRTLKLDLMIVESLFGIWAVTALVGLLYRRLRREQSDLTLHLALSIGMGLTVAAIVSIGLWILLGGWGPPALAFLGSVGLIAATVIGFASFKRART